MAKEVLLDALRLDLQNITSTARAIAQDEQSDREEAKKQTISDMETSQQRSVVIASDEELDRRIL